MTFEDKKVYIIDNENNEYLLLEKLKIAKNFKDRLKGLMFQKKIDPKTGLLLKDCSSIHMFFMNFPLDIIFLDKNMNILKITQNIQPYKIDLGIKRTKYVLEIPANSLQHTNFKKLRIDFL